MDHLHHAIYLLIFSLEGVVVVVKQKNSGWMGNESLDGIFYNANQTTFVTTGGPFY